jgi:hypothetical protein
MILHKRFSVRNIAAHFDVKRLDNNVHVLMGIFFFKVFPDLCSHTILSM